MAMDMFLTIASIKGESSDSTFKDSIEVLSWAWGSSQSASFSSGGGGGSGKANIQDLSITKYIDKASAPLGFALVKGTHIPDIKLDVRKAGDKPYTYLRLTLTDCLISSISTGGSGGEDRLMESVAIAFSKVKMEYFVQGKDGAATAAGSYSWDIKTNVAGA